LNISNPSPAAAALPATFADYTSVQDYLFGLKTKGVKFGIDRMRVLAEALGHPELAVSTIHITGTNGKGSTAAMLDAIFREAGWHRGLYTSPHLVRLGERVQVDRRLLSEEELIAFTNELRPTAEKLAPLGADMHPTFFEFMTAMAFLQFARKGCDVSIIEVGMGGMYDATNVVLPELAVITSVSLDHCEMLGDTIEKIARTKAGIIKRGRPVVIGRLPENAERVVREVARSLDAPVISVREEFGDDISRYPATCLEGDHQRWNAATATLVARTMSPRWKLDPSIVSQGLQNVTWPGRWQRGQVGERRVVFDASHNTEGAEVLDLALSRLLAETGQAPIVVVAALGAARARPLLSTICRYAKEVHLIVPKQARACTHEELEALVPSTYSGSVLRGTVEAIFPGPDLCTLGTPSDVIVVTGSIYLLGEVLSRLEPERGKGEGRLQDF
jgi:dihydrofolate synthase/folylpolyglutamate synthase